MNRIEREAKTVTKWNKKAMNRRVRRTRDVADGSFFKKAGRYDGRLHTKA